ncbi:Hypp4486 [Branchiostoma lanceolatum]|uniref:Hypp4486 protein n=1 Tax=Branchiostoma lanceolatum TaxID=7740 RepID=A0A8K0EVZ5_BRALA|nr:Hypp4486 [Branchiostoma lanceolatum]
MQAERPLQAQAKTRRSPKKKLQVVSLKSEKVIASLQSNLQSKLEGSDCPTDTCPETLWTQLKTIILKSSDEVLGFSTKKNKDFHLQRKLRTIRNRWWTNLAEEIQVCADNGDYRGFYEALKAVYGPTHQLVAPLRSTDGTVDDSALQWIPQEPMKEELDLASTLEEVIKALDQQKSGKAAGVDGIPPEVWKHGGAPLHSKLHELLVHVRCWEDGKLPQDLRDAVIITLHKNKGEKADCSNYRGITLLPIAGKILARGLLNRLVPAVAEHHLPESQCGFRANRGTTDMVFVLRKVQEKYREQNKGLYITFVDLSKAFDTVSRKGLWEFLERLGCPPKFLNMVIQLHEHQRGQVRSSNDLSEHFPVSNGVKQARTTEKSIATIGETELKAVQQYTCLESTISSDARIDKEVDKRLAKANSAFGRLYRRVWCNKHLKKGTAL